MDKHVWNDEETLAFVSFMEELVVDGVRADCGQFKPGSFEKLAAKMCEKFQPQIFSAKHCKNKHKRLKEKYQTAADMLACSGFGWSEEKQCVEVDSKDVLDTWLKAHPAKFYTAGKPFPLFHRLAAIFGKDRANGVDAVDGAEAEEQVEQEVGQGEQEFVNISEDDATHIPPSASHSSTFEATRGSRKRKGKDAGLLERMCENVRYAAMIQEKNVHVLAKAIAGVNDDMKIGTVLREIGFTKDEIVVVCLKFAATPQLERCFWGLEDEQKEAFVRAILHNH